jgi:hypothetical protein
MYNCFQNALKFKAHFETPEFKQDDEKTPTTKDNDLCFLFSSNLEKSVIE